MDLSKTDCETNENSLQNARWWAAGLKFVLDLRPGKPPTLYEGIINIGLYKLPPKVVGKQR